MDGALKLWAVILIVGALNFASRLSFIVFFARRGVPAPLARALRFVPAAMLAALVVPMVVAHDGAVTLADPRVPAALVATAIAFRTRSTIWTLVAGMGALWLGQGFVR
jgi:branched-subunit amino acid transport protein